MGIQAGLEFALRGGKPAGQARITLAGRIHGPAKRLKQRLDDVVRLIAVKQFQMQVAPGLVGKSLKKLTGQAEPERTGHVLFSLSFTDAFEGERIQSPPGQAGPPSKINDTPRQAFIHRHVSLAGEGVSGVKASPVPANPPLISQRPPERLPQGDPAILHRMVRIYREVPLAAELQIQDRVPGKQGQHVVEKRDAGSDGRPPLAVNVQ